MFEPVANDIYSLLHYGITIHEFGLIRHKDISHFGASPDGISEFGIMLEIKCPYKRKVEVNGEIPKQYYYQIQGQLEVCGLKECDYFECKFERYTTWNEFLANFDDEHLKGVIVETSSNQYIYSSIIHNINGKHRTTVDEVETWLEDVVTNFEFIDIKFWYLSHYNLKRVEFDKSFVEPKLAELSKFWDRVMYYRKNPIKYDIEVLRTLYLDDCIEGKSKAVDKDYTKNSIQLSGYSIRDIEG